MFLTLLAVTLAMTQTNDPALRVWNVNGVKREALVFVPTVKTTNKPPLVFDFHGHGGTARHAARVHHIHLTWPEAVVVYMQGLNTPGKLTDPEGKKTGWQPAPGEQNDRDLNFFDVVLDSMKKDHLIDAKRVYSTGHSNGGGFTYVLWAKRGNAFAAFAPVAAAAGLYFAEAKPKPLWHAASEKDPLVTIAMQQRTLDRVKRLNGCSTMGERWANNCLAYPSKTGTPVIVCLHEEGHKYPEWVPPLIVRFFKEQAPQ